MKLRQMVLSAVLAVMLAITPKVTDAQYAYYPTPGCVDGNCGAYYSGWYFSWIWTCNWAYYEFPDGHGAYYNDCGGSVQW